MNKYGEFHYEDYAIGAKEKAEYSSNEELQEGSSLDQLKAGVLPVSFASFEQDAYVTRTPYLLYNGSVEIGFVSSQISDISGNFETPIKLTITFPEYFSMTGITINSRNVVKSIHIAGYQNETLIADGLFSATSKEQFYPISLDLVNRIELEVISINESYHFFGIFSIQYGKLRIFDAKMIESARITNNFSVIGDTLEYDTLDLFVINPEDEGGYLFQRKQPIYFVQNYQKKMKFYVDSGDEYENNTVDILAYDEIANLEDTFLGGLYKNKHVSELIAEILGDSVEYLVEEPEETTVSGYIPICTKRKALQMAMIASNLRCYKKDKLVFKALEGSTRGEKITQQNIAGNPKRSKKQPVRSVVVKKHNYSKNKEQTELHHWYLSKNELTQINFSAPMHTLSAYEVTGEDEFGNDVISETPSENVSFVEVGDNYCIVSANTENKVVIYGLGYSDSTERVKQENAIIGSNRIYSDIEIDLTLCGNAKNICEVLYSLYSKKDSIRFNTLVDVEVGGLYEILGQPYYIKRKKDTLEGLYEVEAV